MIRMMAVPLLLMNILLALGYALQPSRVLRMSVSSEISAVAALSMTLSSSYLPFSGNLPEAFKAVTENPNSLTCTLDTEKADEYHDSCQLLRNVVRIRAGKVLTVRQDWGGSASTGAAVWNGANIAGWFMENQLSDRLQNSNVLILGGGVGFDGLIAKALGASVIVTDGNSDVLRLADENIKINFPGDANTKGLSTALLRWNTDDEKDFTNREWDFIFASDVTYLKKNRADLMATISHLSGRNTITYLNMEPRSPSEVQDTLEEANLHGLVWREEQLPMIDSTKTECNLLCPRMYSLTKQSTNSR